VTAEVEEKVAEIAAWAEEMRGWEKCRKRTIRWWR